MLSCNNQQSFYIELTNDAIVVARFTVTYKGVKHQTDNILIFGTRRLTFPADVKRVDFLVECLYPPGVWAPLHKCELEWDKNYCYQLLGMWYLPILKPIKCTDNTNICEINKCQLQNQYLINDIYTKYLCSLGKYQLLNEFSK